MSLHDFYIEADGPRARNGMFRKKAQRGTRNRGNTIQTTTHGSIFAFLGAILAIITCCVSLPSVSGDPIIDIDVLEEGLGVQESTPREQENALLGRAITTPEASLNGVETDRLKLSPRSTK